MLGLGVFRVGFGDFSVGFFGGLSASGFERNPKP